MELRHLRYFIAVAEEGSFTRAARRLFVAQPALSRQIRDLEAEVGVTLLHRHSRGVRPTSAGEVFLVEARRTVAGAAQAVESARGAAGQAGSSLRFSHGDLYAYSTSIEGLLAAFRSRHPEVRLRVSGMSDARTHEALREGKADVGCAFVGRWPLPGFSGHLLLDTSAGGVLLPTGHPLAASPALRLSDLAALRWLGTTPDLWPDFTESIAAGLAARGLAPERGSERPAASPFVRIAAGDAWALASEEVGAAYRSGSSAVTYRPFVDPPIPAWLALVWTSPAPPAAALLVEVARSLGLSIGEAGTERPARERPRRPA